MINVVDLFCGAGGLSYGFHKDPNFNIVFANDVDNNVVDTYKVNHPNVKTVWSNISEVNKEIIGDIKVDMVIGGPPCQTFSTIGKRNGNDGRTYLFREYIRILKELKPKFFIFENVKGLLSMNKGKILKEMIFAFNDLGYSIDMEVLDAVNYGIPQYRERVFIVGNNVKKQFNFPKKTHNEKGYLSFYDAVSDLPSISVNDSSVKYSKEPMNDYQKLLRKNTNGSLTEHESPNNGDNLVQIMRALPDGGTPMDIPKEIRPASGYANTYCKLWKNKPVPTVTRNFSTPSSSRCIHPIDSRALTTREGARLQSFPDDYIFCGSRGSKNLQIGNAVPPILSIVLKNSILESFVF
ncbi:MAG: DNA cytosine methyltransferase [Alphaproteobacteria bacterium]|nr:DNA cytosine methyltransferase [Alphaproteobacteria bacterium]